MKLGVQTANTDIAHAPLAETADTEVISSKPSPISNITVTDADLAATLDARVTYTGAVSAFTMGADTLAQAWVDGLAEEEEPVTLRCPVRQSAAA